MSKPRQTQLEIATKSSKNRKKRTSSKRSVVKDLTLDNEHLVTTRVKGGVKDSHDRYG